MLADAIAAENLRLTRNRATFFWGFLFIPLLALMSEIVGRLFMHGELPAELRALPVDMADQLVKSFGEAGGPMTVLLSLIGAAVLFAGDYRWETWRLVTPRASRASLFLAKTATFAAWALVTILLIGILDALVAWIGGLIDGSRLTFELQMGEFLRRLFAVTLMSWVQLLFAGSLAALASAPWALPFRSFWRPRGHTGLGAPGARGVCQIRGGRAPGEAFGDAAAVPILEEKA